MLRDRKVLILFASLILSLSIFSMSHMKAHAAGRQEYLDSLNAGISQIFDPTAGNASETALEELTRMSEQNADQDDEESTLVMVNVQVAMNVRAEPGYSGEDCQFFPSRRGVPPGSPPKA